MIVHIHCEHIEHFLKKKKYNPESQIYFFFGIFLYRGKLLPCSLSKTGVKLCIYISLCPLFYLKSDIIHCLRPQAFKKTVLVSSSVKWS